MRIRATRTPVHSGRDAKWYSLEDYLLVPYNTENITITCPAILLLGIAQEKLNHTLKKRERDFYNNAHCSFIKDNQNWGKILTIKRRMDFKSTAEEYNGILLRLKRSNTCNDINGTQKHTE